MTKLNRHEVPGTKPTISDRMPLIMAFALPVLLMLGICAAHQIYPFGSNQFLRTDLYHQYAPFYTDLLNRLKSGESLTYAFDIGLGTNYSAVIAYYLFCPTQLLLYIIPESFIVEFITIMIILKIGLSGYTFAKYLSIRHKTLHMGLTLFGLCYALSGYMAAYSWNIMWLDCYLLAPLILLGLEKLVYEHKPWTYLWTLALAIMTNYYIGIMLCIFAVLYFIGLLIMKPVGSPWDYLKEMGLFALYSLLAGGLAAVVILPAAIEITTTYASTSASSGAVTGSVLESLGNLFSSLPKSWEQYFSLVDVSARSLINVSCEVGLDHWPNIYSGLPTLIFLPMYYMNRRVSYKEKIVKTILIFVFLASFTLNIPNYIWHGMRLPNSLPCRQSFLLTILVLSMCFEGFKGFKGITRGKLVGILIGVCGYILLLQHLVGETEDIELYVYYLSMAFVGLYCLFLYLYKSGRLKAAVAYALMLSVLLIELGVNTTVTSIHTSDRNYYYNNKEAYQTLLEQVDDGTFYRVEKSRLNTNNDAAWIGYNSASLFSSTTPDALRTFYKKLGMKASVNAYAHTGSTPFVESLLSVRYILSADELPESSTYTLAGALDGAYIYENNYTLPLGYMIPSDTGELWSYASSNPIKAQNSLANILGLEGTDLLYSLPGTSSGKTYSTTVNTRSHVYVYVETSAVKSVKAYIGDDTKTYSDLSHNYLLDLGYCEAGEEIRITTEDDVSTLKASAYVFDDEAFETLYNKLSENTLDITYMVSSLSETCIRGTVTAEDGQSLLMSIPYDTGWTVKVDGQVVEQEAFSKALTLIPLTAGTHTIEMTYMPEGLMTGLYISLGSVGLLMICIAVALILRKYRKDHPVIDDVLNLPEGGDYDEPAEELDYVPNLDDVIRDDSAPEEGSVIPDEEGDEGSITGEPPVPSEEEYAPEEDHNEADGSLPDPDACNEDAEDDMEALNPADMPAEAPAEPAEEPELQVVDLHELTGSRVYEAVNKGDIEVINLEKPTDECQSKEDLSKTVDLSYILKK